MGWCGIDVRARMDACLEPKCYRVYNESLRCSSCIAGAEWSREVVPSVFIDESNVPSHTIDDEPRKAI